MEDSKNYCTRFRKLTIDSEKTLRLTELCKRHGTKMSTVFHLIVAQTIRNKLKSHSEAETSILFNISVSLRQFVTDTAYESIEDDQLSYCVGSMSTFVDIDFDDSKQDSTFSSQFWEASKYENERLHSQIKNENLKFFRPDAKKDFNFHFVVTNVGRLRSSITENSTLKVKRNFTCTFLGNENAIRDRLVVNLISCVENQLNWVISFNSRFIQEADIDDLVANYFEILNKILA